MSENLQEFIVRIVDNLLFGLSMRLSYVAPLEIRYTVSCLRILQKKSENYSSKVLVRKKFIQLSPSDLVIQKGLLENFI